MTEKELSPTRSVPPAARGHASPLGVSPGIGSLEEEDEEALGGKRAVAAMSCSVVAVALAAGDICFSGSAAAPSPLFLFLGALLPLRAGGAALLAILDSVFSKGSSFGRAM